MNSISPSSNQKKYDSNNPLQQYLIKNFLGSIANLLDKTSNDRLLDAGCGEGFVIKEMIDRVGLSSDNIVGVDISRQAIDTAVRKLPEVEFKVADITKLPFTENSFDTVICLEVLEHLEDYDKALTEIIRVGDKDVLVSVPWEPFFSLANMLRGKNVSHFGKDKQHINYWSKKQFSEVISEYNVEIVSHFISFPWQIIHFQIKEEN